jgi:hypothetical protein
MNIAILCFVKTISGLPGSFFEYNRYRNPIVQSALRRSISGLVPDDFTERIMAEISDFVRFTASGML